MGVLKPSTRMIYVLLTFLIWLAGSRPLRGVAIFSLSSSFAWHDLGYNHHLTCSTKYHPEKCVNIGCITFRCKTKLKLQKLKLQWTGEKLIHQIASSLYKKKKESQPLLLIEENVVCDGKWNEKKQQLTFPINEKVVATNTYYVIISFPCREEHKLKSGTFKFSEEAPAKVCVVR